MARYDVFRSRVGDGIVLDCQANILSNLNTRFVVPLLPVGIAPIAAERLNPVFTIENAKYAMVTQYASTLALGELGEYVQSLAVHDHLIMNALDMLLTGY